MIFTLIAIATLTAWFFLHINYNYWKRRGVPGPKPIYIGGNLLDNFLVKKSIADVYSEIYKKFSDAPLVGIFRASTPALVIRDPELIKDLTVKSFQNFHDNDLYIDKKIDPILGRNPFFLRGEEWKSTRVHLTPGFTSGKIKWMYPLLEDVSKTFLDYIRNHSTACTGQGCDAKELCLRFTLNNVGKCAFGLDAKCFEEENPEFKQIADRFLTPEGWQKYKVFIVSLIPVLPNLISIKFTPKDVEEKLTNIVTQTLRYREQNNIVRNDFLHILHQLSKTNKDFSEIDVTAHAAGFFADGYETSSVVMSFLLFELAANSANQSKLREEINTVFEENDGTIPYEEIQKLSYLDACFNESLRLHPPLGSLNKVCTKPYTYVPKENDIIKKSFVIEAGTPVTIPLYALQRDPKHFEDPDSFKPERFLNAKDLTKYTFMPFGEGPRACLGQRFGILQVKIGVAYIIKNYQLSVNEKTQLPIKYDPLYFLTLAEGGLWLDFKKIH